MEETLAQQIFQPRSVAVVGASDDPAKTTGRPQQFLERANFAGRKYFINPRRKLVQGERAWENLGALPEVPDHVYILTGSEACIEVVRECAEVGVPVATILASGFAEEGAVGQEREDRLRQAAQGRVRLIGPSSLGVVNPRNGMFLTSNAAFGEPDVPTGGLFVASQSGSVIGALVSRARNRGIGFASLVSVGGEADLSVGAICEAALEDPKVTSFALFLESLRHSPEMRSFARAASEAGKPVAVYKLGRTEAAAELAVSHTGALVGSDADAQAFLAACGFARINHFEGLLETPALLHRVPASTRKREPRVAVVTTTGGGAAVMVDQLGLRGIDVVRPSDKLRAQMNSAGLPVSDSPIIDLGLAGTRHDVVTNALEAMQESGEFDLIVFTIGSSARLNPELAVQAIADRGDHEVPLAAFALPEAPQAAELLNASGVPAFRTPEACADAVAAAFRRRPASITLATGLEGEHDGTLRTLDEAASASILAEVGIQVAISMQLTLDDIDAGVKPTVDFPVVVKALSEDLPHKSDAGAVKLNVTSLEELRDAAHDIVRSVADYAPDVAVDTFLVQEMATGGLAEVLLGYQVSVDAGPVVVLSAGGVLAEVYSDSSVRMAPVDKGTALEMVEEVRGLAVIRGYRNMPLGDVNSLADAVVAMSRIASQIPSVKEAEANPLLVRQEGQGVLALDALVRVGDA